MTVLEHTVYGAVELHCILQRGVSIILSSPVCVSEDGFQQHHKLQTPKMIIKLNRHLSETV